MTSGGHVVAEAVCGSLCIIGEDTNVHRDTLNLTGTHT